jgi:O-antigen/teichoic acid export membrane protein
MNLTQRVLWNTGAQIAGKLVILVCTLVSVRLTTTYLGVDRFGDYAIVLAIVPVAAVVADLGLSLLLARELARDPERRDALAGTLAVFRLAGTAVVVVLAAALLLVLPYERDVKLGILLGLTGVFAQSLASLTGPFFQVALRMDLAAAADVATALVSLGVIVAATQLDLGFFAVVVSLPAAYAANLVLSILLVHRFWRPRLAFDRALARRLGRTAVPIAALGVLGLLHFRVDSVLLSLLKPPRDVGIYTVAFRYLEWALILPGIFMAAMFPILTAALSRGERDPQEVIERAFNFLLLLALPLALGFVVFAAPLVELVAPRGFEDSVLPLRILAGAVVFTFLNAIFAGLLFALDRQSVLLWLSAGGLALNIVLNLIVIPRWSYNGAAVTTVVTEALGAIGVFLLARRAYHFRLRPRLVTRDDVRIVLGRYER